MKFLVRFAVTMIAVLATAAFFGTLAAIAQIRSPGNTAPDYVPRADFQRLQTQVETLENQLAALKRAQNPHAIKNG